MLTIGPYKHNGDSLSGEPKDLAQANRDLYTRTWKGLNLPALCADGLETVFPDLPRQNLHEFRLYAQRPRGEEIIQMDVELIAHALRGNKINIEVLDEDENVVEEVVVPDNLHKAFLEELGLSWGDVVYIDPNPLDEEDKYDNTYTAWLRIVDLGPAPFDIDDAEIDIVEGNKVKLLIYASHGGMARVEVDLDLSSTEWEFD